MLAWNFSSVENVADVFQEGLVQNLAVSQQEGHCTLLHATHGINLLQVIPELRLAIPAETSVVMQSPRLHSLTCMQVQIVVEGHSQIAAFRFLRRACHLDQPSAQVSVCLYTHTSSVRSTWIHAPHQMLQYEYKSEASPTAAQPLCKQILCITLPLQPSIPVT